MTVRTREVELAAGHTFADFLIEARLARSETGTTYRARRLESGRVEALKLLSPRYAVDRVLGERVSAEALHPALAAHPSVLEVYEVEEAEGHLYIATRWVEHGDLRRLIAGGGLAPTLAVELLGQLASVLDTAHRVGIVHGGVSAGNVLVERRRALLADFGLDRGRAQEDPREDVRGLGRLLAEMLTGHPFPTRDGLPPAFARVVDDALSDEPGRRLETAGEVGAAALGAAALTAAQSLRLPTTPAAMAPAPRAARVSRQAVAVAPAPPAARVSARPAAMPAARISSRAAAATALAAAIVLGVLLLATGTGEKQRPAPPAPNSPGRHHARTFHPGPRRVTAPAHPSSPWPSFASRDYRLRFPPGWHVAENDAAVAGGAFTETRFVNAGGTAEIDVDRTPQDPLTPAQAAALVRGMASRYAGYRELAFHPTKLAGGAAWEWRFLAPPGGVISLQGPRIDLFRKVAGARYATLGVGTGVPALAALTRGVAASIRAR